MPFYPSIPMISLIQILPSLCASRTIWKSPSSMMLPFQKLSLLPLSSHGIFLILQLTDNIIFHRSSKLCRATSGSCHLWIFRHLAWCLQCDRNWINDGQCDRSNTESKGSPQYCFRPGAKEQVQGEEAGNYFSWHQWSWMPRASSAVKIKIWGQIWAARWGFRVQ